jgi:hypothetical protein
MFFLFALLGTVALLIAMAVVAVSVNDFAKQMESFRKILDARYTIEPVKKTKKSTENKIAPPASVSPLDAVLRKTG